MPDQDSHPSAPDSDHVTTEDRGTDRSDRVLDLKVGSVQATPAGPGRLRSSLETALDHDDGTIPLREIVGDPAGPRSQATRVSDQGLQATTDRVIEAREETARHIAQSLHDEAFQMLALAFLELTAISQESPEPIAKRIEGVIGHLDTVCQQIRDLSHEWRPLLLERHGLVPALHKLGEGVSARSGLPVKITAEVPDLPPAIELAIYRVVQEALSNVVRHASASEAEVRLWKTKHTLHCSVSDDGVGFQPPGQETEARYESGLGLVGIQERVDSLGGDCQIRTGPREGMELNVGIPI